jgi:stage V sporulation protein G
MFEGGLSMQITEVRVKLMPKGDTKLRAFCSMTIDDEFVIREIKIIQRNDGYFVAMPSRKMSDHCPKCGNKNHLRARYCNHCGTSFLDNRDKKDSLGRIKLHADIAHPINAACRQRIQQTVIEAFQKELDLSQQPGYHPQELGYEPDDIEPSN